MRDTLRRAIFIWIISSVAIMFIIFMSVYGIFGIKIGGMIFLGISAPTLILNFMAFLRMDAYYYFWDGLIPRLDGKNTISEREKEP